MKSSETLADKSLTRKLVNDDTQEGVQESQQEPQEESQETTGKPQQESQELEQSELKRAHHLLNVNPLYGGLSSYFGGGCDQICDHCERPSCKTVACKPS